MDPTALVSAGVAVFGTLSGVVLTNRNNRRNELERRQEEKSSRWLDERLRICRELLLQAVRAERKLYDVLAFLPDSPEPGHKMREQWSTILISPKEDLPGVIDKIGREILVEAIRYCLTVFDEMDSLKAELSLLTHGPLVQRADNMIQSLWDVVGDLEVFADTARGFEDFYDATHAREAFNDAAREELGLVQEPPSKRTTGARAITAPGTGVDG